MVNVGLLRGDATFCIALGLVLAYEIAQIHKKCGSRLLDLGL